MFARQFKKIIPFNLLLGGGISLVLVLAVFFGGAQEIDPPTFFKDPLLFWLGMQLLCYFMIGVEEKEKLSYFKCFPLLLFGLALLWFPFKNTSVSMFIEVGVLFWVFNQMVRVQKGIEVSTIFNLTLVSVLLIFYDATHFFFLLPLYLFFVLGKLFLLKTLIAFILPLVLVPFFLTTLSLYWAHEALILKWPWVFSPWDIKTNSFADFIWLFFILMSLFLVIGKENLKKPRLDLQITFGLLLWVLSALVLGFLFTHDSYSRWDWTFCPTVLLISHVFMKMQSDRLINTLLGIIFVGGILTRIFIL